MNKRNVYIQLFCKLHTNNGNMMTIESRVQDMITKITFVTPKLHSCVQALC